MQKKKRTSVCLYFGLKNTVNLVNCMRCMIFFRVMHNLGNYMRFRISVLFYKNISLL